MTEVDREKLEGWMETLGNCGAYFDSRDAARAHERLGNPEPSPLATACSKAVEEIGEALGVAED